MEAVWQVFFLDERANCAEKRATRGPKGGAEPNAGELPFLTEIYCHFTGAVSKLLRNCGAAIEAACL